MHKLKDWTIGVVGFVTLTATVLFGGCGLESLSPVTPGVKSPDPSELQYVLDNYGDPFAGESESDGGGMTPLGKSFKLKVDGDSATVGQDGGTLEMQMRGFKSKLKIPKDALSSDVTITVEGVLFQTPVFEVLLYDFSPDGLQFNLPAELEVDAGRLEKGTTFNLYWWNPLTELWEFQQECVVDHHKIKFDVHHFSKYGISRH